MVMGEAIASVPAVDKREKTSKPPRINFQELLTIFIIPYRIFCLPLREGF
jgi:hypothetical protein